MLRYFLVAGFLLSQLIFLANSNAGDVQSMSLLNNKELSSIEARGIKKTAVNARLDCESKIILWDEQVSVPSNHLQVNGGIGGNFALSINNNGMGH